MNLLDFLLKPMYNKSFKELLEIEFWQDAKIILALSKIYMLDSLGESEFNENHEAIFYEFNVKYDHDGTCPCGLYLFVSRDLRQEYDTIHCLIRSILDDQFR